MWKSYDETDRNFILNIVVSQLYLTLAFRTSLFLSQGHELEMSITADQLKEVTPLCSPVQVYFQHHRLFVLAIFLISPPACADVCEKDYFKLNDELFFFFLFPLLKHMDIFQTGGCKRAVKTRSRLFTRYFDENLWRWPSREAAAAQRTIFDCVHQRHLVLQLHSLVITGPHPNVRHLCSIPSPLST